MTDKAVPVLLHPQHKLFADKYLSCGNITQSAKDAGYSERSAHTSGHRLLKRPDVQEYLAQRGEELSTETKDLQTRWLEETERLAFASIADFIRIDEYGKPQVDFSNATEEQLRAIAAVKSKSRKVYNNKGEHIATEDEASFVLGDKYRGLDMIAKHLGLYKAEEQRVVVDVADRLLAARQRLAAAEQR